MFRKGIGSERIREDFKFTPQDDPLHGDSLQQSKANYKNKKTANPGEEVESDVHN